MQKAVSPIAFYIKKSHVDISSLDEKRKFLSEILGVVKSYSDDIEKDSYLKEISRLLDIPTHIIYDELKKHKIKKEIPENTEAKTIHFSQEDMILGYIYSDHSFTSNFKDGILFWDALKEGTKNCITSPSDFFTTLDIEKKEQVKALSFKISEEEITQERMNDLLKKINIELYKKQVSDLKNKMSQGDESAFTAYSELVKVAKQYGIK